MKANMTSSYSLMKLKFSWPNKQIKATRNKNLKKKDDGVVSN